jgi:cysteinyl-tRNA synthetase
MLKVYNTLTRRKEEFTTREKGKVYMYNCGLTPYDYPHVGHGRSAIVYDIIHRYLEFLGYEVVHISNFTDIDDRIIERSRELGVYYKDLAEKFASIYLEDLEKLNVKPLYKYPRATEHIEEIVKMVKVLQEKGYAYEISDGVYFEVSKFKDYGKLSHRNLSELRKGARVEVNPEKKDPLDFALWKKAKEGEPSWDSPWGKGRPGWHIECSAMTLHYLGNSFDIHGGGDDLIFPHHENEIAQSEAYTGKTPFARYWVHNGMIEVGKKEKMSKSLKNFFVLDELLKNYEGNIVRLYFISASYRKPLNFDLETLELARKNYEYFVESMKILRDTINRQILDSTLSSAEIASKISNWKAKFIKAMDDDFNTPVAISIIFDIFKFANTNKDSILSSDALKIELTLKEILNVLGFKNIEKRKEIVVSSFKKELLNVINELSLEEGLGESLKEINEDLDLEKIIEAVIEVRLKLRKKKQFIKADKIRTALKSIGILLEDTTEGTTYKLVYTDGK